MVKFETTSDESYITDSTLPFLLGTIGGKPNLSSPSALYEVKIVQNNLEKLRKDAEAIITTLEETYAALEARCVSIQEQTQDIGEAYDILEEIVTEYEVKIKELQSARRDVEDRMTVFETMYNKDMRRLDESNQLMTYVSFVGITLCAVISLAFI